MPAFVNNKFGAVGNNGAEGTISCSLDLKKSRNDWRISEDVMIREIDCEALSESQPNGTTLFCFSQFFGV
jgi:hypothetical protein